MLVRLNSWPFTGPLTLVSLSDYENAFLNVEPERIIGALRQYPAGTIEPDALAFGLVVFEMTFGFELDSSLQLSRIREHDLIPAKAPPVIKSVCLSLAPSSNLYLDTHLRIAAREHLLWFGRRAHQCAPAAPVLRERPPAR